MRWRVNSSSQNIGKTRLVRSLCQEEEVEEEDGDDRTFIAHFFRKKLQVDNWRIKMEFW